MAARRVLRPGPPGDVLKGPAARRTPDRQPGFQFDPMPERVEPCLAKLAARPPAGDQWSFEVKWDGFRVALHIGPQGRLRILTKNGHDWTRKFPDIAAAARSVGADTAIIDGEAVVLDARGASDFGALQRSLGRPGAGVVLYAFDLLYLNGHDLRSMPCEDRRSLLSSVLGARSAIRMSEDVDADGDRFFKVACALQLEGIIGKRKDKPYRGGRGGEWVKIKCVDSETFLVIGYQPAKLGGLARLLLAARKDAGLSYVGSVGTGFKAKAAADLRRLLDKILLPAPTIPLARSGARWVRPVIAVEIQFRGWTGDGKLRHASFKGVRGDADLDDILEIGGPIS